MPSEQIIPGISVMLNIPSAAELLECERNLFAHYMRRGDEIMAEQKAKPAVLPWKPRKPGKALDADTIRAAVNAWVAANPVHFAK